MSDGSMTLQEVADELGVHYMTAYRYVRLGQIDAHKAGGTWRVTRAAFESFQTDRTAPRSGGRRDAPWSERFESRLLVGDASGAWAVVEASMSAGTDVAGIYLEVVSPAMRSIGERWANGEIDVAVEHRASGIVTRIVGRLGSHTARPGRARGSIVLGSPAGERHSIVVAILADLLRLEGWEVSDLGADTPRESFVAAAQMTDDLVAIGLSVTHPDHLDECSITCAALRDAGVEVPIVVGGRAVRDVEHARSLGADTYARDAAGMVAALSGVDGSAA